MVKLTGEKRAKAKQACKEACEKKIVLEMIITFIEHYPVEVSQFVSLMQKYYAWKLVYGGKTNARFDLMKPGQFRTDFMIANSVVQKCKDANFYEPKRNSDGKLERRLVNKSTAKPGKDTPETIMQLVDAVKSFNQQHAHVPAAAKKKKKTPRPRQTLGEFIRHQTTERWQDGTKAIEAA